MLLYLHGEVQELFTRDTRSWWRVVRDCCWALLMWDLPVAGFHTVKQYTSVVSMGAQEKATSLLCVGEQVRR